MAKYFRKLPIRKLPIRILPVVFTPNFPIFLLSVEPAIGQGIPSGFLSSAQVAAPERVAMAQKKVCSMATWSFILEIWRDDRWGAAADFHGIREESVIVSWKIVALIMQIIHHSIVFP